MDANERRRGAGSEAAEWFARLQSGDLARAEREQFVKWLSESYVHVAEMLRIAQIHGSLEQFQRWGRISTGPKSAADNVVSLPALPNLGGASSSTVPRARESGTWTARRPTILATFAATVILAIAATLLLSRIRGQVIATDQGERRQVVLADGSLVQIDPETRLRIRYAAAAREVFLEHGRALFHVAKAPNRPFLVRASDTTIQAVGTAFGVEQRSNGLVVTVAEGKVAVVRQTSSRSAPSTSASEVISKKAVANGGNASGGPEERLSGTLLTANQQVTVASSGSTDAVQEVDSSRVLAWADGRLIFQNDEIGQVVNDFNRYNHMQIAVSDPDLSAKLVSGVFNAAEPEAFIAFLQSVTPVQIVRFGDANVTIKSAQSPH